MTTTERYDVIVIGSGAGGGTMAYTLAPTGKKILLLERGDFLPREADNWSTRAVMIDGKYGNSDPYYDKDGNPFAPSQNHYVGGNTKFYGAVLLRLRALGAVAHSIIVAVYAMLSRHEPYHDLGSNYFDERQREQVANRLVHRLEHLGYTVEVAFTPASAPAASG